MLGPLLQIGKTLARVGGLEITVDVEPHDGITLGALNILNAQPNPGQSGQSRGWGLSIGVTTLEKWRYQVKLDMHAPRRLHACIHPLGKRLHTCSGPHGLRRP